MTILLALANPFGQPFLVHGLVATAAIAVAAGPIGWFVVARREAFAAHTLSMMAFPGGAVGAALGLPFGAGYFVLCFLAALLLSTLRGRAAALRWLEEPALVGTVGVAALAAGFLALALYGGVLEDLEALLFGSPFGVSAGAALALGGVAALVVAFFAVAGRPLLLATVDPQLARAAGVPAGAVEAAFVVLLGFVVAATAQVSGALLVFSLLVAPPAAAQRLTSSVATAFALSFLFALGVGWLGLILSYWTNLPPGFLLSALGLGLYLLATFARLIGTVPLRRPGAVRV